MMADWNSLDRLYATDLKDWALMTPWTIQTVRRDSAKENARHLFEYAAGPTA